MSLRDIFQWAARTDRTVIAITRLGLINVAQARNAAFSALVIAELLRSFGARSNEKTVWQIGLFSNMRLFVIVAASFVPQLLIHHLPVLETLFGTEPISVSQCVAWVVLGAIPLIVLELGKVFRQSSTPSLQNSTGYPVS
jgi:Ca2+-transporting ATPase